MLSEIAAEQMVEVVKNADTAEHLTILFRDLLEGESEWQREHPVSLQGSLGCQDLLWNLLKHRDEGEFGSMKV